MLHTQGGNVKTHFGTGSHYYINDSGDILPEISITNGVVVSLGGPYGNGTDELHPSRLMIHPSIKIDCPDATTEELMELTEGLIFSQAQHFYDLQYYEDGKPKPITVMANGGIGTVVADPEPATPLVNRPRPEPDWMTDLAKLRERR